MYQHPPPNRSRVILGDGSAKKVEFIGKFDLIFHSSTKYPVTRYNVSFVPGLGFTVFSFRVLQEHQEIVLNRVGAHIMNGRLSFPCKENGSYIRATGVPLGQNVGRSIALVTFDGRPLPPSMCLLPLRHPLLPRQ